MVLSYRFEGGRLVLSGKVATLRVGFDIKNVDLRKTSAEPEMANPNPAAPAVAGAGGSPAGLKFTGDVFSFVAEAVRDKRLIDVDIRGFTLNKDSYYRDVCEEGGVLIGFEVGLGKFGANDTVGSLRPIFRTKDGEKFGQWHGPAPATPITVKAKPGYVVSSMLARTQLAVDGFTLTFARLGPNGLDLDDTYNGKAAGGNGGQPSTIGGDKASNGALFVGVAGHLNDGKASSLGLIAVLPKK
jgi:hypothetical protein